MCPAFRVIEQFWCILPSTLTLIVTMVILLALRRDAYIFEILDRSHSRFLNVFLTEAEAA